MKIIKEPTILKKPEFSIKVRLIETKFQRGIRYEVQYYNASNKKWTTPDYGVGSAGWVFMSKQEAIEFWDNMFDLNPKQMAEKYEAKGRWAS